MPTLTGFETQHETADEWRAYIARIDAHIAARRKKIEQLRAAGRGREALDLAMRDAIHEHRARAREALRALEAD